MATSIGSDVFAVLALITISLLVLLLLRHYLPLRTTAAYLLVPVFFALALPILLILLVPIDLASSARDPDAGSANARAIWLPEGVLLASWRIAYWLTFALTWFILPLLGEYCDSGDRTPRDKVLYSLRSNARYQLTVLALGIVGLFYIFIQNGFRQANVKALVMALAYCWALVQAIYLMGHGLVAVPRRLFKYANIAGRLRRLQERAPKIHEKLEDAVAEVRELDTQVSQLERRKVGLGREEQEWINEMAEASASSNRVVLPATVAAVSVSQNAPPVPAAVTPRYLADLNRRIMRARHKRTRFIHTWNGLVQEAGNTQAILESKTSKRLEFKVRRKSRNQCFGVFNPFTRYYLHVHLIPVFSIASSIFLGSASICIVWSELVKHVAPQLSIITYLVIRDPDPNASVTEAASASSSTTNTIPFFRQLLSSFILTYMCLAALSSLGAVPIWGNRALVRRTTYPESATWYAGQVAKLTVPLAFNFVTLLPPSVYEPTAFFKFLGRLIQLYPLGRGFENWFQFAILIPVAAALFNVYGRLGKFFGGLCGLERLMGAQDEEDLEQEGGPTFGSGSWREGRELIQRELRERPDAGTVSLVDSRGPSFDIPRNSGNAANAGRYRDEPTMTLGPAAHAAQDAQAERQARYAADRERRQRERLDAATQAAADEDFEEGVLEGFAHRVKNTVDSVEAPDWFVKRPKWLGGQGDGGDYEQAGGSTMSRGARARQDDDGDNSDNDLTRAIGRIFGGNRNEGRLRLG